MEFVRVLKCSYRIAQKKFQRNWMMNIVCISPNFECLIRFAISEKYFKAFQTNIESPFTVFIFEHEWYECNIQFWIDLSHIEIEFLFIKTMNTSNMAEFWFQILWTLYFHGNELNCWNFEHYNILTYLYLPLFVRSIVRFEWNQA